MFFLSQYVNTDWCFQSKVVANFILRLSQTPVPFWKYCIWSMRHSLHIFAWFGLRVCFINQQSKLNQWGKVGKKMNCAHNDSLHNFLIRTKMITSLEVFSLWILRTLFKVDIQCHSNPALDWRLSRLAVITCVWKWHLTLAWTAVEYQTNSDWVPQTHKPNMTHLASV